MWHEREKGDIPMVDGVDDYLNEVTHACNSAIDNRLKLTRFS